MDSTQSSTSVPSWPRLQNIRSIASRNFCPGTSPPHSRPALPKPLNNSQLGVRLKIGGHLELRDTLRVKRGDSHAYSHSAVPRRSRSPYRQQNAHTERWLTCPFAWCAPPSPASGLPHSDRGY